MTQYLLILASAFLLAVGATPLVRRLAARWGIVDKPNARKIHTHPIPLMGGVAIYGAFIVSLVVLGDRFYVREVAGIFLGATLCSFMGLWDDRSGLSALKKLVGQIIAACILLFSGVQVRLFPIDALNGLITVFWVVGITNALNLLDNMDGLSGGVAAVASAFFLLLAAMSKQYLVGALAAALLGACVGFLAYNFNPASIFMGDAGSLFIGFVLASVGIKLRFPNNVHFVTWMIPVMVLGLPIFDTTLVVISRLRRGLNPLTTPGKDHVSHRLVKMGFSQREAVLILYQACSILGVIAMYLTQASIVEGYVIGGMVFIVALYLLWRLEKVGPLTSPKGNSQGENE
ncbi:MAG: undecaprenyl/decaprenyl-phosphate alpha-N-acetylglucosaminyl 1-phosphate transferase [Anaerolineae bacterium]|nr:undecaprenyl/decaprenyl-phosphate alpha-N-acetylglucosaminyl 1-phosphate transferase [Anaerolineae bacterium]